jgi:hypothetical protein
MFSAEMNRIKSFKNQVTAFTALLLVLIPMSASSQEPATCAENLKSAESAFERGQVELVPALLYNCMKSGFKREEQIAAYKLLIQSYLFEDRLERADSTMLAFLKKFPEYQLSPTDHSSFVFLFNTFRVRPLVQMTFHFGTNLAYLTFVDNISTASEGEPGTYGSRPFSMFASLEARVKLNSKFEVALEGAYSQIYFSNEENLGTDITYYSEIQHRIELPVSALYNFSTRGKLTPYLRAGAGAAIDLSPVASAKKIPLDLNNPDAQTGPDINRNDSRILADIFATAGAGIKLKTPRGFISFEARTNLGVLNQFVSDGNSAQTLYYKYGYVDDDFNINTLNFTFGYTQIFYKPSKIR